MLIDIQAEKRPLFAEERERNFMLIQRELQKALNIYDNIAPSDYLNKKEYERAVDLCLKRIELYEMEMRNFLLAEKSKAIRGG
jgi:hypothetical protein